MSGTQILNRINETIGEGLDEKINIFRKKNLITSPGKVALYTRVQLLALKTIVEQKEFFLRSYSGMAQAEPIILITPCLICLDPFY